MPTRTLAGRNEFPNDIKLRFTTRNESKNQDRPMGGENATRTKVAIGPRRSERRNQLRPLRFFPCAIPALIRASVPHPTANSGV